MLVLTSLLSSCKNIGALLSSDDTREVTNQYDLVKEQMLIEGNKDFIANRPFMFMIYEEEEAILFIGSLVDLESKEKK